MITMLASLFVLYLILAFSVGHIYEIISEYIKERNNDVNV